MNTNNNSDKFSNKTVSTETQQKTGTRTSLWRWNSVTNGTRTTRNQSIPIFFHLLSSSQKYEKIIWSVIANVFLYETIHRSLIIISKNWLFSCAQIWNLFFGLKLGSVFYLFSLIGAYIRVVYPQFDWKYSDNILGKQWSASRGNVGHYGQMKWVPRKWFDARLIMAGERYACHAAGIRRPGFTVMNVLRSY